MNQTVLFVDDEPHVLSSYKRAFRSRKFRIRIASNADIAIDILKTEAISLVVSDYRMPGANGIKLLEALKKDYPDIKRIMVSGEANKDVLVDAVNLCQIFRYFEKPCNDQELGDAIEAALGLISKEAQCSNDIRSLVISQLEEENPGISKVIRDERGTIIVKN